MRARRSLSSLVMLWLLAAVGFAQELPSELRGGVEALYTVTAAPGGISLEPREPRHGVTAITVAGDTVRVNGAKVTPEVLRAWVGNEADLLLRLAQLSPAAQRRLFGLDPTGAGEAPPAVAVPAEAEPTGEAAIGEAPAGEAPPAADEDEGVAAEAPAVPTPPAPPRPPGPPPIHRTGSQFTMFNDLTVGREESAQEAVAIFGSVRVEGEVRGDVTAVFGSVWVDGRVDGEVVAVFGSVYLGPEAEVLRGVTAVGGEVEREEGAIVRGAVTEVPVSGAPRFEHEWPDRRGWGGWGGPWWGYDSGWGGVWSLFWRLVSLAVMALFLTLTYLLATRVVERVAQRSSVEWWKAGLAGLLALVLYVPAVALLCVLLAITIVGCALIPFVVVGAVLLPLVAWLVGYAGISLCVGRWLGSRLGWRGTGPYGQLLAGFGVLEALRFVGGVAGVAGGAIAPFGWGLLGLGDLVRFVAVVIGVGAWLLNRFAPPAALPAPPPGATAPGTLPPVPGTEPPPSTAGDAGPPPAP